MKCVKSEKNVVRVIPSSSVLELGTTLDNGSS